MRHISFSESVIRIYIWNILARLNYVTKLGAVRAFKHAHIFKRWTGSRNLLCWCGAVRLQPINKY